MRTFVKVWIGIALMAIGFGIGIIGIALVLGDGRSRDIETTSYTESYEGIENIDMQVAYGEVNITDGDKFSIHADNILDDELESYVENGTWYIKVEPKEKVRVFGIHFSLGRLGRWNGDHSPEITVTIPKEFKSGEFGLDIGAGSVEVDSIDAKRADFNVDAGRLSINTLQVDDQSSYNVGTGQMVLDKVVLNDIALDCGVGSIEINGSITGHNEVSCGVGKIKLDLIGNESDYSYDISAGIGNVVVNGNSYHDVDQRIDNGTGNNLRLDCGIGNITVDFN